ncbi:MAG: hypothetical protein EOO91_17395 [Pedobacter sp.]|nr:MAG: hypothetical protein EOO91_17395 [Pedobacter sp.]
MKRSYLILLLLVINYLDVMGQEKMVIKEEDWVSYTYQEASKTICSLDKLPYKIQKEVKILTRESFWGFRDSIHFINAQIVDIERYLKDGDPHKRHWVVPKYEINFYLKDESIGIIRYNLTLHLDGYGQILKINWPINGYGSKKTFLSRDSIKKFALDEAKKRNYNLDKYSVNFEYNGQFDRLCWEFCFLEKEIVGGVECNFITIPWDELTIVDSTKHSD